MSKFKIGERVVIWRKDGAGIYDGNPEYVRAINGDRYGLSEVNEGGAIGYVEESVLLAEDKFRDLVNTDSFVLNWKGDEDKLYCVLDRYKMTTDTDAREIGWNDLSPDEKLALNNVCDDAWDTEDIPAATLRSLREMGLYDNHITDKGFALLAQQKHDTDARAVAGQLTEPEIKGLLAIDIGANIPNGTWRDLNARGLVGVKYTTGLANQDYLTDLGKQVVAALRELDREPARPASVTAREFVEQGYAEKVKRGECMVWMDNGEDSITREFPVLSITIDNDGDYCGYFRVTFKEFTYINVEAERRYNVRWLTDTPQPASATAPTAAGAQIPDDLDVDAFQHAIINIHADIVMGRLVTTEQVNNAVKAHDEIVSDLQSRVRDLEAEAAALLDRIESALAKYAPTSKPTLSTSLSSKDYARQYGAWQIVELVREALQAQEGANHDPV